jgi:hypothetical protein
MTAVYYWKHKLWAEEIFGFLKWYSLDGLKQYNSPNVSHTYEYHFSWGTS